MVQIFLKGLNGKETCMDMASDTTLGALKRTFQQQHGVPISSQRLMCGGRILHHNEETLFSFLKIC